MTKPEKLVIDSSSDREFMLYLLSASMLILLGCAPGKITSANTRLPPENTPTKLSASVFAVPTFTPDDFRKKLLPGVYLVYWSQDTWYMREVGGSNSLQLLPGISSEFYTEISLSPDGDRVVFSRAPGQVSVYDLRTHELTNYPNPKIEHAYRFQWLRDGKTLLYLGTPEQHWIPDAEVGIYSISLQTGKTSKVVDTTDDRFDYGLDNLSLSPNGKWLAFDTPRLSEYSAPDPEYAIYVMDTSCLAASETCTGSFHLVGDGYVPEWSPDGRLWWSCSGAGQSALCVTDMHAPTASEVFMTAGELTSSPEAVFSSSLWSPDGKHVAINVERSQSSASGETRDEVYLVPVDKSQPVKITAATDRNEYLESWSPDSRYLAYSEILGYTEHQGELGIRFPITDLYLYDTQTNTKIDLVDPPGDREVFGFFMIVK